MPTITPTSQQQQQQQQQQEEGEVDPPLPGYSPPIATEPLAGGAHGTRVVIASPPYIITTTVPYDQNSVPGQYPGTYPQAAPGYAVVYFASQAGQDNQLQAHHLKSYIYQNMVMSIVSIFCCFPLGIIATVKSFLAGQRLRRGDVEGAKSCVACAHILAVMAILLGSIVSLMELVFILMVHFKPDDFNMDLSRLAAYFGM